LNGVWVAGNRRHVYPIPTAWLDPTCHSSKKGIGAGAGTTRAGRDARRQPLSSNDAADLKAVPLRTAPGVQEYFRDRSGFVQGLFEALGVIGEDHPSLGKPVVRLLVLDQENTLSTVLHNLEIDSDARRAPSLACDKEDGQCGYELQTKHGHASHL
jgi:hypothetical protein